MHLLQLGQDLVPHAEDCLVGSPKLFCRVIDRIAANRIVNYLLPYIFWEMRVRHDCVGGGDKGLRAVFAQESLFTALVPILNNILVAAMWAVWPFGFWPGLQHECGGLKEG